MTWTQPICDTCWHLEPTRAHEQPHRVTPPQVERCCLCGRDTLSGIYVRYNPAAVPYPTEDS